MGRPSSLAPYLNASSNKLYLRFSLTSPENAFLGKVTFPFLVVTDSDPLTRLIQAHFVTDAGNEIRKVFALVQRDLYLLPQNDLHPIQNPDIVENWQRSLSFYEREKPGSVILLSGQTNDNGKLEAFSSLFFCKKRKIFFSPPCPTCGCLLQQCEEDQRLLRAGLLPYSTSMKRYLFCPSCDASGHSDFYTFELEPPDPPALKDRWELMKDLGQFPVKRFQGDLFPCAECPDHQACFGSEQSVLSRMVPFSFYPFFMLMFDGMSLHALDFLSLLSGATFDEVEASLSIKRELGRIHCLKTVQQYVIKKVPLLFDRSEKYFLELLYLKLSFLGEVFQDIVSRKDELDCAGLRLSIDRCWIKLSDHGTILPFFWDFKVRFIALSGRSKSTPLIPRFSDSDALRDLGLFWFYALLANQEQDLSSIYAAIGRALNRSVSESRFSFSAFLKGSQNPIFSPKNIFWDPGKRKVRPNWHVLWERALDLGLSLLRREGEEGLSWSEVVFKEQCESLRDEVKDLLFAETPLEREITSSSPSKVEPIPNKGVEIESKAIFNILMKILERWRSEGKIEEKDLGEHGCLKSTPENISGTETLPPSAFRSRSRSERGERSFLKEEKKEEEPRATDPTSPFPKRRKIETRPMFGTGPEKEEKDLGESKFFKSTPENISGTETLPPSAFRSRSRSERGKRTFLKEGRGGEESQATEIVSRLERRKAVKPSPEVGTQAEGDEFIAETVIIGPRKADNKGRDEQDG